MFFLISRDFTKYYLHAKFQINWTIQITERDRLLTLNRPGGADSAWGELPYEEYMGSYFQEKIPKRVCHFFTKIPERAIISVRNSR